MNGVGPVRWLLLPFISGTAVNCCLYSVVRQPSFVSISETTIYVIIFTFPLCMRTTLDRIRNIRTLVNIGHSHIAGIEPTSPDRPVSILPSSRRNCCLYSMTIHALDSVFMTRISFTFISFMRAWSDVWHYIVSWSILACKYSLPKHFIFTLNLKIFCIGNSSFNLVVLTQALKCGSFGNYWKCINCLN